MRRCGQQDILNFLLRGGGRGCAWDSVSVGGGLVSPVGAVEESRDVYGAFSAITQRRQKGALITLVDQSCKWYSDTCRAVLAESATEQSGNESFLEEFATKKGSGLRSLFGADRALCGVADGISAVWVDAARKSGVRFAQSMSPKASRR